MSDRIFVKNMRIKKTKIIELKKEKNTICKMIEKYEKAPSRQQRA